MRLASRHRHLDYFYGDCSIYLCRHVLSLDAIITALVLVDAQAVLVDEGFG